MDFTEKRKSWLKGNRAIRYQGLHRVLACPSPIIFGFHCLENALWKEIHPLNEKRDYTW